MKTRRFSIILFLFLAFSLGPRRVIGQTDQVTSINTDLVLVNVVALDRNEKPSTGLKKEQFQLFVDGVPQEIDSFSIGDGPISYGVVFDMHPTVFDRTKTLIAALQGFQRHLGPADDVFMIAFDMRGEQTFDFIPTAEQLERHMARPDRPDPGSLYDATYMASEKLASSRNSKRALLIISDAADHNSRHKFKDLRRKITGINTQIYALIVDERENLGYVDLTKNARRPFIEDASALDKALISDLATQSGGKTFDGSERTSYQLRRVLKEISNELHTQYTLGFYPAAIDGAAHKIRIKLRGVEERVSLMYRMKYRNPRPATR